MKTPCPHRRTSVVTEERFEPLFGLDVPVESTTFRICDDCGAQLGTIADAAVILADPACASVYGEPQV